MPKEKTRSKVLLAIEEGWPISVTEACQRLGDGSIAKVKYHFDRLAEEEKIRTKKIGRNLVAWPVEIEKLRLIHEMMK